MFDTIENKLSQIVFDVETLAASSEAVVLSAAMVHFDLVKDQGISFDDLLNRAMFVKFKIKEQAIRGRIVSHSTINWWKKQDSEVQKMSFNPDKNRDVSVVDGLQTISTYAGMYIGKGDFAWCRGNFDNLVIESLYESYDMKPFVTYSRWMEIRTFMRVVKETCNGGAYADVPGFDKSVVKKHDPIHDVCFDALQILNGK